MSKRTTLAYARFQRLFRNQEALVRNTSPDALPASLRVRLSEPEQFEQVPAALGCEVQGGQYVCAEPGIEAVYDQRQLLNRLFAVIRVLSFGVGAVAVIMLVSAIALIANTVRMGLFARRKEIGIMKLVGATNWRIRVPFLIEGLVESLLGAGAAIVVLFVVKAVFVDRLRYQLGFLPLIGNQDVLATIPWLLGAGTLVALVAGTIGMRRFLDV